MKLFKWSFIPFDRAFYPLSILSWRNTKLHSLRNCAQWIETTSFCNCFYLLFATFLQLTFTPLFSRRKHKVWRLFRRSFAGDGCQCGQKQFLAALWRGNHQALGGVVEAAAIAASIQSAVGIWGNQWSSSVIRLLLLAICRVHYGHFGEGTFWSKIVGKCEKIPKIGKRFDFSRFLRNFTYLFKISWLSPHWPNVFGQPCRQLQAPRSWKAPHRRMQWSRCRWMRSRFWRWRQCIWLIGMQLGRCQLKKVEMDQKKPQELKKTRKRRKK